MSWSGDSASTRAAKATARPERRVTKSGLLYGAVQKEENLSGYCVKTVEFGNKGSLQHRILFRRNGWQTISPWHDISLFHDETTLTFVCTTPRGEWINNEVGENEIHTPLRVKSRNGKPTHFAQNLPYNYGFLPQTAAATNCSNMEAIRVFDIGATVKRKPGDLYPVKPIAAYLVTNPGAAMSWHVISIDAENDYAGFAFDIDSLSLYFPGVLDEIASWLITRNSVIAGDEDSCIALGGAPADYGILRRVIIGAHASWKFLHSETRVANVLLDLSRPLSGIDLEQMWQVYTAKLSKETIGIKEPRHQASLKYNKAWEYVMSKEESEEESELDSCDQNSQFSSRSNSFRSQEIYEPHSWRSHSKMEMLTSLESAVNTKAESKLKSWLKTVKSSFERMKARISVSKARESKRWFWKHTTAVGSAEKPETVTVAKMELPKIQRPARNFSQPLASFKGDRGREEDTSARRRILSRSESAAIAMLKLELRQEGLIH